MTLKIAIHDCFYSSGESAMADTFCVSAQSIGIDVKRLHSVEEIEVFAPDFVIVMNPLFPKLTRFPTYTFTHEPLSLGQEEYRLKAIPTYDGYLFSTGEKAESYARDLAWSMKKAPPKFCFLSNPVSSDSVKKIVDFHHESMKYGGWTITDEQQQKEVAVIIGAGGRSLDLLKRNLESLKAQIYKNILLVIVLYKEVEGLDEFLKPYHAFFNKIEVIKYGGINSTTVARGLRYVYDQKIPYFCILDDDDEYFPNHISNLVTALCDHQKEGGTSRWAYAMWMVDEKSKPTQYCQVKENRRARFIPHFAKTLEDEMSYLAPCCVLIETSLLDEDVLQDPLMHTAGDSHLWRMLYVRNLPLPSFRFTSLQYIHGDNCGFMTHPLRQFDLLKLKTRFLGKRKPDGSFWATDIVMEQKPISGAEMSKWTKLTRLLKICKKVLVNTPRLMKAILRRIEGM